MNAADSPSTTAAASSIDNSGSASSSVIVPTPIPFTTVAPDGALNSTVNVSSASDVPSSSVATVTVRSVSPGSKRSTSETAV